MAGDEQHQQTMFSQSRRAEPLHVGVKQQSRKALPLSVLQASDIVLLGRLPRRAGGEQYKLKTGKCSSIFGLKDLLFSPSPCLVLLAGDSAIVPRPEQKQSRHLAALGSVSRRRSQHLERARRITWQLCVAASRTACDSTLPGLQP